MTIEDDGRVILDDSEYKKLSEMLHYIAIRFTNWSGLEYDDIKSELWIKTLDTLKDMKKIEPSWIAKCCFNVSHDLCRKAKRKWDKIDTNSDYLDSDIPGSPQELSKSDDENFLDNINIQELVDRFPRNSRERNYLVYLSLYLGIPLREHEEKHLTYEKVYGGFPADYRRELVIAKALGFSDDTSTGYRKAKYEVRQTLSKIYDIP